MSSSRLTPALGFILIVISLLAVLFTPKYAHAKDAGCQPQRGLRTMIGPEPITAQLRVAVETTTDLLFNTGRFDEERFNYIGLISFPSGGSWHVVLLETIWGCSHRSTPRLLIFSSSASYLGQYSHAIGRKPRIEGKNVVFDDIAPGAGDRILFSESGPPAHAWIDGENPEFYK